MMNQEILRSVTEPVTVLSILMVLDSSEKYLVAAVIFKENHDIL